MKKDSRQQESGVGMIQEDLQVREGIYKERVGDEGKAGNYCIQLRRVGIGGGIP